MNGVVMHGHVRTLTKMTKLVENVGAAFRDAKGLAKPLERGWLNRR